MSNVIAYASDVMPGDVLANGYVESVEDDGDVIILTVSAYAGSVITESIVLPPDAHVLRRVDA